MKDDMKKGSKPEESPLDQLCNEIRNRSHEYLTISLEASTRNMRDQMNSAKRTLNNLRMSSKKALNIEIDRHSVTKKQLKEARARIIELDSRLHGAGDIETAVEKIEAGAAS